MPKLFSLKVTADMEFFKAPNDESPPGQSDGDTHLCLSLARPGGGDIPLNSKFSVTLVPILFPSGGTLPPVVVEEPNIDSEKSEGFYRLACYRTAMYKQPPWVSGIYVFGVKVRLTIDSVNYVGQTLVRLIID